MLTAAHSCHCLVAGDLDVGDDLDVNDNLTVDGTSLDETFVDGEFVVSRWRILCCWEDGFGGHRTGEDNIVASTSPSGEVIVSQVHLS